MSLRALVEVAIHLESFRNIDLYFQGIYYARLKLFQKKRKWVQLGNQGSSSDPNQQNLEDQIELAQPYCNFVSHVQEQKLLKMKTLNQVDHHSLLPPKIEDDTSIFLTKAFLIRYCEEEVELHDIVLFRAEIDVEPDYLNTEFFLECELFFSDLSNLGGPEKWQEHIHDFETQAVFKQVQSQLYSIKRLPQGICEFCPLTFQDQYFSMLSIQVQSVLIDYRFRLKSLAAVKQAAKVPAQKPTARQIGGDSKFKESQNIVLGQGLPFLCQTVADFFFADLKGNLPPEPNMREVDTIFSDYVRVIVAMYEKLRMTYNSFVNKFLTNEQRKELQLYAENSTIHEPAIEETKSEGSGNSMSEQKMTIAPTTLLRTQNIHKTLSKRIQDGEIKVDIKNIQAIANVILTELNFMAGKTLILYHKLVEIIKVTPRYVSEYLQVDYEQKTRERWMESILRHVTITHNFALLPQQENNGQEIGETHKVMAKLKRKAASQQAEQQRNEMMGIDLKIQAQGILQELVEYQPIIFEECFVIESDKKFAQMVKQSQEITEYKILESLNHNGKGIPKHINPIGVHLFVMCHGFQGNHGDMRLFRNQIALLYPDSVILLSTSNEDMTEGDIFEMGERLATEVKQYILSFCPSSCLAKLSFIGHSLGGLIIRAALPHLAEYSSKFFTYISLSSPHLGYMYNSNKLLDAGMWVLKNWKKSKCMSQLSMTDSTVVQETCLFRLTQLPGFEWFKNIILCCSYQDKYVPFDSARIQICKQALDAKQDSKLGYTYIQMATNLLGNLPIKMVYRLDVNFHIPEKNMDSWIGRTAHIQFLECQSLMKMLVYRYKDFFN